MFKYNIKIYGIYNKNRYKKNCECKYIAIDNVERVRDDPPDMEWLLEGWAGTFELCSHLSGFQGAMHRAAIAKPM